MLPLTLVLRKMKARYKLQRNMTLINYLLFMDDLKLYGANRDQLDSLVQTMRIFSEYIQMSFGLHECALLQMKSGRKLNTARIELQDDKRIKKVEIGG